MDISRESESEPTVSVHPSYLTPEGVVAAVKIGALLERIRWMRGLNALLNEGRPTKAQLRDTMSELSRDVPPPVA